MNLVPKYIPGVMICYRDAKNGDSRFVRWIDLPSYPELMATDSIGNLMTKGLIEKAARETQAEREKKLMQKMKWIKEELE